MPRHAPVLLAGHLLQVLAQLDEIAGGRTELLIEAAGVLLGGRPPDTSDPRWQQRTDGADMLLELAGVKESDAAVQAWVAQGAERRNRWRRPEQPRGIA
jgi:hypothetical protein